MVRSRSRRQTPCVCAISVTGPASLGYAMPICCNGLVQLGEPIVAPRSGVRLNELLAVTLIALINGCNPFLCCPS